MDKNDRCDAMYSLLTDIETIVKYAKEQCAVEDVDGILSALENAEYDARMVFNRLEDEIEEANKRESEWNKSQYERAC